MRNMRTSGPDGPWGLPVRTAHAERGRTPAAAQTLAAAPSRRPRAQRWHPGHWNCSPRGRRLLRPQSQTGPPSWGDRGSVPRARSAAPGQRAAGKEPGPPEALSSVGGRPAAHGRGCRPSCPLSPLRSSPGAPSLASPSRPLFPRSSALPPSPSSSLLPSPSPWLPPFAGRFPVLVAGRAAQPARSPALGRGLGPGPLSGRPLASGRG